MAESETLQPADFEFLSALVREHGALVLGDDKQYLMEYRLIPVAKTAGCSTIAALVRLLQDGSGRALALRERVFEALTTNETWFFRDFQPFEVLQNELLPDLLTRRKTERRIRIWSAGCSSGQEPYSIAMQLDQMGATLDGWTIEIVATDASQAILDRARTGRYTRFEVNRGMPARLLVEYFREDRGEWELSEKIRSRITFRQFNLAAAWPSQGEFDIILIRNVLIYFAVETRVDILKRMKQVLRPDGALFLGTAESTIHYEKSFVRAKSGTAPYFVRAA